jgi:predicted PurR-regulated permease PerM
MPGKDLRLPDYLILISTVGGISLFGMKSFVPGPLIATLFVSVWSLVARESMSIETDLRANRPSSPEQQDGQRCSQ